MNKQKRNRAGLWFVFFLTAAILTAALATTVSAVVVCGDDSEGEAPVCSLARAVLYSQDAPVESNSIEKPDDGPLNEDNYPTLLGPCGDPEITLVWEDLIVTFEDTNDDDVYDSQYEKVPCSIKYTESGGTATFTLSHNSYDLYWNEEGKIAAIKYGGVVIEGNFDHSGGTAGYNYDRGAEHVEVEYTDDRPILITVTRNTKTTKKTYIKYTEDDESVLVRKRVTVETYNSDGSKRFLTTIYVYHPSYYDHRLWFVVEPEGVRRYLKANSGKKGIDPDDPGETQGDDICELDDTSEETGVPDTALDDYASVIYHEYDGSGRVTKVTGSAGCGACSGDQTVRIEYDFVENPADENSWAKGRRIGFLDSGGTLCTDRLRTAEYFNEYGQMLFHIKMEMSGGTIGRVWITHNEYHAHATDYGDELPRLIEVRNPSACSCYAYSDSGGTFNGWIEADEITTSEGGTAGLVRLYEYYTTDSATTYKSGTYDNTHQGGFKGKLHCEKVRKGTGGSDDYWVRKCTYVRTDYDNTKTYNILVDRVYPGYTTADSGEVDTTYDYVFYSDSGSAKHTIEEKTITYHTVGTDKNGSGVATTVKYRYKQDTGNDLYYKDWTMHEDGTYSYTELGTGTFDHSQVVRTIVDVKTATASPGLPSGWTDPYPSDGLDLTTTYNYYDESGGSGSYGQLKSVTDPAGKKTKYCYMCQRDTGTNEETTTTLVTLVTPHIDDGGTYSYAPLQITVTNLAGRTIHSAAGTPHNANDGDMTNDWDIDTKTLTYGFNVDGGTAALTARTDHKYDLQGRLLRVRRYHNMPVHNATNDTGILGTNYHRTVHKYESTTGRLQYMIQVLSGATITANCVERISENIYDDLGRVEEVKQGVSAVTHPMGEDYGTIPTLHTTSKTFYDQSTPGSGDSGVGDGNGTCTHNYFGSGGTTDFVRTDYHHDYRGHLRGTATAGYNSGTSSWEKFGPFGINDYDNMDRTIASAAYDNEPTWGTVITTPDYAATTETNRKTLSKTYFDQKGQVYKSEVYNITGGTASSPMTTNYWYDAVGRNIKVENHGGMFAKTFYDGAGRATTNFACYDTDEPANQSSTYTEADDVDGDTVIRASWTEYNGNRAVCQWAGTKLGDCPVYYDPNHGGGGGNMVRVSRSWYDSNDEVAGGDLRPYLTAVSTRKATTTVGDSDFVVTRYDYDTAGRQSKVTLPAASGGGTGNYTTQTYDDLGRLDETEVYTSGGTLLAKSKNTYGDSVHRLSTGVYEIQGGTATDYLKTSYDYDDYGRLRKTTQPSGSFTLTDYTAWGRVNGTYLCTAGGTTATINDDIVVEQSVPSYDSTGRIIQTTAYQRNDNDTSTPGALISSIARVTYRCAWYDGLSRVTHEADYGTYGGSSFSRPTNPPDPSSSSTVIITKYDFDGYGRNYQVTDNAEHETRTFYDSGGRRTHVVENYEDFVTNNETDSAGGGDNDEEDRVTKFTYVGPTNLLKEQIAIYPDNADKNQVTSYIYAVDITFDSDHPQRKYGGPVYSNDTLRAVTYPDGDSASSVVDDLEGALSGDFVELTYYADGSTETRKDQREVVHTYEYDNLGRQTADKVTSLGSSGAVDGYVRRISRTYDDLGRPLTITSAGNTDGTTVRNEIKYTYADGAWGNLTKSQQDHAGEVTGGEPDIDYTYTEITISGSAKNLRLQNITYPNERDVHYNYFNDSDDPVEAIHNSLNRVRSIASAATADNGTSLADSSKFAQYDYLGAGTVIEVAHPAVHKGLTLTYDPDGNQTYAGFDLLGRIVQQKWTSQGAAADRFKYGYDAASNRKWRENNITHGGGNDKFDEYYTYDGLDRLKNMDRGSLTGTPYSRISTPEREQDFTLDQVGNWTGFVLTTGGTVDLNQSRLHNDVNEIDTNNDHSDGPADSITASTGENWVDPKYDAAGNMIEGPRPSSPNHTPGDGKTASEEYRLFLVYDAWNRLVEVYEDTDDDGEHDTTGTKDELLGEYRHDGLNRRIVKLVPADFDGYKNPISWNRTDYYYNTSWQCLEERYVADQANKETVAANAKHQYVWGVRYIDAAVLRDEDTNSDGDCTDGGGSERLYYCQDANFNVTAMAATNSDYEPSERYVYDPYGKVTIYDDDWSDTRNWSAGKKNEILFCGYRYDPETGLMHVRHRPYHCTLGRWTVQDHWFRYADGMNLYENVASSPVRFCDPYGLTAEERALWKKKIQEIQGWIDNGNTDVKYHKDTIRYLNKMIRYNELHEKLWAKSGGTKNQKIYYKKAMKYYKRLVKRGIDIFTPCQKVCKWLIENPKAKYDSKGETQTYMTVPGKTVTDDPDSIYVEMCRPTWAAVKDYTGAAMTGVTSNMSAKDIALDRSPADAGGDSGVKNAIEASRSIRHPGDNKPEHQRKREAKIHATHAKAKLAAKGLKSTAQILNEALWGIRKASFYGWKIKTVHYIRNPNGGGFQYSSTCEKFCLTNTTNESYNRLSKDLAIKVLREWCNIDIRDR